MAYHLLPSPVNSYPHAPWLNGLTEQHWHFETNVPYMNMTYVIYDNDIVSSYSFEWLSHQLRVGGHFVTPAPCWWSYHYTSSMLVAISLHQLHVGCHVITSTRVGGHIITPAPCWWSYHYTSPMLVVISLHQLYVGGPIITPAPCWWSYHNTRAPFH